MTMLVRIATALYDLAGTAADKDRLPFHRLHATSKQPWYRQAKTALRALRDLEYPSPVLTLGHCSRADWQRMIDALIEEPIP